MITKKDLKKINKYLYEIPKSYRSDMRVPARFYADETLLNAALQDNSLEQLVNITTLPGIVGYGFAMPDIHQGYGFPIGGVGATKLPDGVISPGGVGYDINCGVRSLLTHVPAVEVKSKFEKVMDGLFSEVPSGVGSTCKLKLSAKELDKLLDGGSKWIIENGYGRETDLESTESYGSLKEADHKRVSKEAKKRGLDQVGTLGAGNHFLEIQVIDKIFDKRNSRQFRY
jgi:tRNA-splicing ligase RtcB